MADPSGPFDHIVIVMFENQYRSYVLENDYFASLAAQGINVETSFGVMHPSQTNYIASIAGELCNVTGDERPPILEQRTIVDLLEDAGLTWKAYMDGYLPSSQPWSVTLSPVDEYPYVIKHNPFSSFEGVLTSKNRWSRIGSEADFWTDVAANQLPHYSWFTPNMWNDGHYLRGTTAEPAERAPALVDQAAEWLEWFFGALRFPGPETTLPPRTLVVVTFDEADFEADWDKGEKYTYDGPNQIYTVLLGDGIDPAVESSEGYNHYSLLRTVEENFGLGSLEKNDVDSNWFRFLWGDRFEWDRSEATPLPPTNVIAAARSDVGIRVVGATADGELWTAGYNEKSWSSPTPIDFVTSSDVAMAGTTDGLVLVFTDRDGALVASRSTAGLEWSEPEQIFAAGPVSGFALAACNRDADAMVCINCDGQLLSLRRHGTEWGPVVDTGHRTNGVPTVCSLGHTLLLVFAIEGGTELEVVSYTTADFNTTKIEKGTPFNGPQNNAVANQWSPTAVPVAHFAAVTTRVTQSELEPLPQSYRTAAPVAMTELDGVVHLVYSDSENAAALTTTCFSMSGMLTPDLPISYDAPDTDPTTSNGYGTILEAGWTTAVPICDRADAVVLCAASDWASVYAILRSADGTLEMIQGRYGPAA